jgi:transposase
MFRRSLWMPVLAVMGQLRRFTNDPKGIAKLAEFCQCHKVHLVAMEATGGYEKKPFALLWAAGESR